MCVHTGLCLLYMCPHTSICVWVLPTIYVSSYIYICVSDTCVGPLPTIHVSSYGMPTMYVCSYRPLPTIYVSSYIYMCVLILGLSINYSNFASTYNLPREALEIDPFQVKVLQVVYILWGHIWQYEDTEDTHKVVVNMVVPATGCQMRPSKSTHFRSKCLKSSPGGNEHSTDL